MKILFCDWNGTILDDDLVWHEAMRETFRAFGKEPPTTQEYFQEVGSGYILEIYRKRGILASREALDAIYKPAYKARMFRIKLSAGAKRTLVRLKKRGVSLVLLTAQNKDLTTPLMNRFSLCSLFAKCFFSAKDKRTFIETMMLDQNADPKDCLFVGDAPSDMLHAKQAGICAIGFCNRANSEELLRAAGADYCIQKFSELETII